VPKNQYVAQDVVSYIDSHFRTIPNHGSRGVFGISSGGFGAWHLGSRHPDIFGAMALQSADSYFEYTHKPWFYDSVYPQRPNGPQDGVPQSRLCYGLSACYTPNVTKPPYYVDLPIEFPSGAVIEHLWEQWLSYDPVVSWRSREENLRQLRGILLDVGYNDEYGLHYGHRLLSQGLTQARITHQLEEHDGRHDARLAERFQVALTWFSEVLVLQD
jgi:enterochelin esterase family protein